MKKGSLFQVAVKTLITAQVVSGGGLSLITSGYVSDVPVVKHIYTIMSAFDGWGIEALFLAMAIGYVYYRLCDMQKARTHNPGTMRTIPRFLFAIR